MMWRCLFRHDWSKWTQFERSYEVMFDSPSLATRTATDLRQRRTCVRCGYYQECVVRQGCARL